MMLVHIKQVVGEEFLLGCCRSQSTAGYKVFFPTQVRHEITDGIQGAHRRFECLVIEDVHESTFWVDCAYCKRADAFPAIFVVLVTSDARYDQQPAATAEFLAAP